MLACVRQKTFVLTVYTQVINIRHRVMEIINQRLQNDMVNAVYSTKISIGRFHLFILGRAILVMTKCSRWFDRLWNGTFNPYLTAFNTIPFQPKFIRFGREKKNKNIHISNICYENHWSFILSQQSFEF